MNMINPHNQALQSPVYKQDCLQAIFHAVQAGRCVRVLGPRFRSKSALMLGAAQMIQEHGTHEVHYLSMKDLPNLREESFLVKLSTDLMLLSEADLYAGLFSKLQQELFPMDTPTHPELMQTSREFREGMEMLVRRLDRPLVLFLSHLNDAPPNVVHSLLNTLADLYTAVSYQSGPQFQAVVAGALHLEPGGIETPTRFLSQSDLVWVDDLDPQEQQAYGLAACQRAKVTPDAFGLELLLKRTGGNLFLIERILRLCLKQMARRGQTELTSPRVSEGINTFLNNPLNPKVEEVLRQVEANSGLLHCTLMMLERGSIPLSHISIPTDHFPNLLDLCGVFQREENSYRIKSEIWGQLLQQQLNPARVGGFYAVNGRWQLAFEYLGRALNEGQSHIRPALFTAVLNAMHASQNALGAFDNLAQGIVAAFPESDLRLYIWQDSQLNPFYPDPDNIEEQVRLENPQAPEIQALSGVNYTIAPVKKEIRLLIPLCSQKDPGRRLGLVSLGKLVSQRSPYQRQDEVMQLVGFLQQAAQVVEERAGYAKLLESADLRVTKLNRLNGMLTKMLHHREWSEAHILQLALKGITSPYGLDLNRAVFFMVNKNEQCLQVPFAMGQLTQQKAEAERQFWLQQSPETALSATAVSSTTSPLQNALYQLQLPLHPNTPDLILHQLITEEAFLSRGLQWLQRLDPTFAASIDAPADFALIPLTTGEQTLGILYVDNKFSTNPISQEQFELLQTFVNQVALVLENARTLVVERQRTSSWRKLLKIEERLNNQVTNSVGELLQSVVEAARELFKADSVVIYPFSPTNNDFSNSNNENRFRYEPALVTATGTQAMGVPTNKPRPTHGMAMLLVQEGYLSVPDVETAVSAKLRRCIDTSTFIDREAIHAFTAIRLGSATAPAGILYLNWTDPHQITHEQKTVLEVFANFVAVALPGARTYQHVQHNLSRRNLQLKRLDQVFSNVYFDSENAIDNTILLTLRGAKEYTNAPHIFLLRNEPKGTWGVYQLLSSGRMHAKHVDDLPHGLIRTAYTKAVSRLETNAGRLETGEFRTRLFPDSRCGLAIPVKGAGNALAVLYLESPKREGLTKEHKTFLEKMASRLAVNLEQADRNRALAELRNLSQRLADEANLEQLLAAIITQALTAMQTVDAISVYHQDPETEQYIVTSISGEYDSVTTITLEGHPPPIVQRVWRTPGGQFIPRLSKQPELRRIFPHQNRYEATAVFPLEVGHTRVGCIFFGYEYANPFSEADKGILELFAQLAALAILRTRLHTDAEQRQQRLETVSRITPIISASVSLDLIFPNLIKEILNAFPKVDNACIVKHLPEKNQVAITANTQQYYKVDIPMLEDETFRTQLDKRRGVAGRVIETGMVSNIPDVGQDIDYIPANSATQSEIAIPIHIDEMVPYILVVESNQKAAFTVDDQELLTTLSDYVALAIKNAEQFQRAKAHELTRQTAVMATGLIHDINNAVATFPDLIDEITYNYENGRDIKPPLANLLKSTKETDKISGRLKDFVITGAYTPELRDIASLIHNAIGLSKPQKPPHVSIKKQIPI